MIIISKIKNKFQESKLFRYFTIYSIGRIIGTISSILLLPLFTKTLPQNEFGIIGILWLAGPILARITNLGVDVSVSLKYFKLEHKELSNYLFNALSVIFLFTTVIWVVFILHINWIYLILDESMTKHAFSLFMISILSVVLLTMMQSFLTLAGKAWLNVIFTVVPPIIISIVTYYLILFINPNYKSYIIGMAIGNGIFGIVAIIYFLKEFSFRHFKPSLKIVKKLLKVGIPVIPGTLAGLILTAGDRYIIKYLIGLEAVAIYTFGYRFSEYILISIFQPFQKAIFPIIMQKAADNYYGAIKYVQSLAHRSIVYISIFVAIIIIPFKDLIFLLSSDLYTLSYNIFLVSLIGILLNNISSIYIVIFNHLERTDINMIIGIICAILNIVLNILFIPVFGIIAAAYTTVISYLLSLVISLQILNRITHLEISILKTISNIIPLFLYMVVLYLIDRIYVDNYNHIALRYIFKIIAFCGFLVCSYTFSKELRNDTIPIKNKLNRQ